MNTQRPLAYCQACQNFITEGQSVARCGSLIYHSRCAPAPLAIRHAQAAAPARNWLQIISISLLVLGGGTIALFSGLFVLALCLVFPLFGLFLLWLPFALAAQASRRAFIRNVAKEAARDGARAFVSELAKYRN